MKKKYHYAYYTRIDGNYSRFIIYKFPIEKPPIGIKTILAEKNEDGIITIENLHLPNPTMYAYDFKNVIPSPIKENLKIIFVNCISDLKSDEEYTFHNCPNISFTFDQ